MLAQGIEQRGPGIEIECAQCAVDVERELRYFRGGGLAAAGAPSWAPAMDGTATPVAESAPTMSRSRLDSLVSMKSSTWFVLMAEEGWDALGKRNPFYVML